MQNIQTFNFKGADLRILQSENGEPLFIVKDVAEILDYRTASDAVRYLDEDERLIRQIHVSGQNREVNLITESGLYSLVLSSRKPEAKVFKKWVTSEVLPSIRKHGMYATSSTIENLLSDPDSMIRVLTTLKEERAAKLEAENIIKANAPKVLFAESVCESKDTVLVKELAGYLTQNGVKGMGQNKLYTWLRSNNYLCQKGAYYNLPTQRALNMELFEVKKSVINQPDGTILTNNTTKVTGKGMIYFLHKFLSL